MAAKKGRAGLLVLGISIGLLAGMALAFWLGHSGWNFSRFAELFSSGQEQDRENIDMQPVFFDTGAIATTAEIKAAEPLQVVSPDENPELSIEEFIEMYNDEYPDSVLMAAYELNKENKINEIQVAKDEMLFIKLLDVEGMIPESGRSDLDSILLDDRNVKHLAGIVKVEFWKSPINYTGYKWDTRKLVLFGMFEFENLRIKYISGQYYLEYNQTYYELKRRDSFQSLFKVSDRQLIDSLNKI
jgi:hypothetical protein